MRTHQIEWLAAETTADRDARLQQMSALQHERSAAETTTERDTRLQRMRDRLAAETTEERDARLECDRARHREQQTVQSQLPLLQQCSIQAKIHKFHANTATLDTPVCKQ